MHGQKNIKSFKNICIKFIAVNDVYILLKTYAFYGKQADFEKFYQPLFNLSLY